MIRSKTSQMLTLATLASAVLSACGPGSGLVLGRVQPIYYIQATRQNIGVGERDTIRLNISNPSNNSLEFRFSADRGQMSSASTELPYAEYIAPFSGGPDTIRVSVYDRTDNVNLPMQQFPILVMGDGAAYVEAPPQGQALGDAENGVIKVAGVQGQIAASPPRQVAVGRQPTISPDGRYLAYTFYPGNGTSQIRVQDAAGNVTILSGNGNSFSRDPAWAPIGSDRSLNLVFASDRLASSTGQGFGERGDSFNLWRTNVLGQNLRQLSSTPGSNLEPVWSPNGQIVIYRSNFSQNQIQSFWNLWRLDMTSGRLLQLTYETVPQMGAFEPSFSPDGNRLVYTRKYLSRQPQNLFNFQKVWMVDLNSIDIPSLLPYLPGTPGQQPLPPGTGAGPVPVNPVNSNPSIPGTVSNLNGNFGTIATQEFDEGTLEGSPSFSVDGGWITYVQTRGDEIRTLRIPGNPGNLGTIGFQPLTVPGVERALEVDWARQPQSFFRPF